MKRSASAAKYATHKGRAAERQREQAAQGRDIGAIPPPANPARRRDALSSLMRFCEIYGRSDMPLEWGRPQLAAIDAAEKVIRERRWLALALARGSGKTLITAQYAPLWGVLRGDIRYCVLIGATMQMALRNIFQPLKSMLELNALLAEDFPEITFPIRALDGCPSRAPGQLCGGERTRVSWGAKAIRLPAVRLGRDWPAEFKRPDGYAMSSGAFFVCAGLTSAVRGEKTIWYDGSTMRPDYVVFDDPQTEASAANPERSSQRVKFVSGTLSPMGGPAQGLGVVIPCTPIRKNDFAEQILAPDLLPEFTKIRIPAMASEPTDDAGWAEHGRILRAQGRDAAIAYYRENRERLDAGAEVAWPAQRKIWESAIQHLMVEKELRPDTFASEYQLAPLEDRADEETLTASAVKGIRTEVPSCIVPDWGEYLICTVDVGSYRLHYEATAWDAALLRCHVVDAQCLLLDRDARDRWREIPSGTLAKRNGLQRLLFGGLTAILQMTAHRYQTALGEARYVGIYGVDIGGAADGEGFAGVIHDFCRAQIAATKWIPLKGAVWGTAVRRKSSGRNFRWSAKDAHCDFNADAYKLALFRDIMAAAQCAPDQRPMTLAHGLGEDNHRGRSSYYTHLHSEALDPRTGRWAPHKRRRTEDAHNHWLDTHTMNRCIADMQRDSLAQATEDYDDAQRARLAAQTRAALGVSPGPAAARAAEYAGEMG